MSNYAGFALGSMLFVCLGAADWSQRHVPSAPVSADSTDIEVRVPSSDLLAEYRNNPEYTYESASQVPPWWDRLWSWIFQYVDSAMDVPGAFELLVGIVVLVIGGGLVFAVYWLFRMRRTQPVDTSSTIETDGTVTREALERVDFLAQAEEAEAENLYRHAIRYHYLGLLQRLMKADLIDWTPEKANQSLVRETSGHPVHDSVARATDVFEAVWYGDLAVDASTYERLRDVMVTAREQSPATSTSQPTP